MSKAEILGQIRRGLGRTEPSAADRDAVASRIAAHKANLIPARAQIPEKECQQLFIDMAREAAADVIELNSLKALPSAIAEWLDQYSITDLVAAVDAPLPELCKKLPETIHIRTGVAQAGDLASLTTAFLGIAETGTLMLYSRPDSPTTLNFLPDNHLVVLNRSDIVGVYEEAWAKVRELNQGKMPRTVNMITGPSRSADIEQKLQMGAHGPRRLAIFLID
ncbi:LutC/YkgG family protein [Nitrincola schmidtii]|uniref:LutC/YkgG family protein n=1 Tax=Nitrincola schmidtii TaxID=1730894 RepID=UPI00124C37FC|nr:LUD domain-containing protein [Nitrincola schmidtii]